MQRIHPISDYPMHIATVAQWHWDEWGHADPQGSLAAWTNALEIKTEIDIIPTTFVALGDDDEPIGSVSLVESDMSAHPELTPWVAGLFVIPARRGCGIGVALMEHAVAAAAQMGVPELYLHTSAATELYMRLGWKKLFRERYEGEMVDVMHYYV
ncbi:MAG: GNAT family N-acetyltransferase [Pseudomonadales bacterium]